MFSTTCNVWTKLGHQTEYQKKGSRSKKTYNIYMNEHRCHMYVDKFLTEARLWPRSGWNEAMFATIKTFAVGIEI